MSRIVIVGGHGKVALLTAPLLVADGHQVTSLIRNPDHTADVSATGATAVVADVEHLDRAGLADALGGHDVLVWAAGAGGGNPARTRAVDRDAAMASMDVAAEIGIGRYVMVSYLGSRSDHGVDPDNSFFAYADAKAAADDHLRASSLAWTILGPGALTDEPGSGRIEVAERPAQPSVPRADVAAVVAAAVARPSTAGHTIAFNTGPTPIEEALEAAVAG